MSSTSQAKWERATELPLAGVAAVFLGLYSYQVLAQSDSRTISLALWLVWVVFGVDYIVRLALAPQRIRWFFYHLPELAVVALPLLRPLRLLRLITLVRVLQRVIGGAVHGRVLIYTVSSAVLLIYVASLAALDAERAQPNATITTFADALWWAISTVTTVGYGDYSPTTTLGRAVAVMLMIGGISLIGVVTATVAAYIVQRVAEEDAATAVATAAHIEELRGEIRDLRLLIERQAAPITADDSRR